MEPTRGTIYLLPCPNQTCLFRYDTTARLEKTRAVTERSHDPDVYNPLAFGRIIDSSHQLGLSRLPSIIVLADADLADPEWQVVRKIVEPHRFQDLVKTRCEQQPARRV